METELLDRLPLWAFLLFGMGLMWLALEAGYRFGAWRRAQVPDEREPPVLAMVGSILGLLALVLGFTFSLAASRFEARRLAVLEEANAIGTAYLRTSLLPEPHGSASAHLLQQYVDSRLELVETGHTKEAITRAEELHGLLWAQADAAAKIAPGSVMTGLYVQSLNEVIDLHAKRVLVGLRSRIPLILWAVLLVMTLVGMAAVGYEFGLSGSKRTPVWSGLIVAFAVVVYLTADLDRGQSGLLRVSQQALLDLRRSIPSGH